MTNTQVSSIVPTNPYTTASTANNRHNIRRIRKNANITKSTQIQPRNPQLHHSSTSITTRINTSLIPTTISHPYSAINRPSLNRKARIRLNSHQSLSLYLLTTKASTRLSPLTTISTKIHKYPLSNPFIMPYDLSHPTRHKVRRSHNTLHNIRNHNRSYSGAPQSLSPSPHDNVSYHRFEITTRTTSRTFRAQRLHYRRALRIHLGHHVQSITRQRRGIHSPNLSTSNSRSSLRILPKIF